MTPIVRAQRSARAMMSRDAASQWMGFTLDDVGEGTASMSVRIEEKHLNGHGICHGGLIFSLADSAFAFACNSRNSAAVAQSNSISYVRPGRLGDVMTARAREVSLTGRSGVYDVEVTGADGTIIAAFRGNSRIIGGAHFDEAAE